MDKLEFAARMKKKNLHFINDMCKCNATQ